MFEHDFSSILQRLRKERKVTQEQLAQNLGVSPQAVSKWENGSFPDGDLLPKIADFFEVSIDYLYGREFGRKFIEQTVLNEMQKINDNTELGNEHKDYAALIERIIWAFQLGMWQNGKFYFPAPITETKTPRTASVLVDNVMYSYYGMNRNNEFYMFFKEPLCEGGYAEWLKGRPNMRALFKILADDESFDILTFLYSLGPEEFIGTETIADELGIDESRVKELVDRIIRSTSSPNVLNGPIIKVKLVEKNGQLGQAYGVDLNLGGLFVGLCRIADEYADHATGYQMQTNCRTKSWIDRKAAKLRADGKVK